MCCSLRLLHKALLAEQIEEFPYGMPGLQWMPQLRLQANAIMITTSFALTNKRPTLFKVSDNALHCAFRDPHLGGDIPQAGIGVACQADQHMSVVGQKRPMVFRHRGTHVRKEATVLNE